MKNYLATLQIIIICEFLVAFILHTTPKLNINLKNVIPQLFFLDTHLPKKGTLFTILKLKQNLWVDMSHFMNIYSLRWEYILCNSSHHTSDYRCQIFWWFQPYQSYIFSPLPIYFSFSGCYFYHVFFPFHTSALHNT